MSRIPMDRNAAAYTALAQRIENIARGLEKRLLEVDSRVKVLEERRGPGRPPKAQD